METLKINTMVIWDIEIISQCSNEEEYLREMGFASWDEFWYPSGVPPYGYDDPEDQAKFRASIQELTAMKGKYMAIWLSEWQDIWKEMPFSHIRVYSLEEKEHVLIGFNGNIEII
jgi:hypothetical protein